MWCPECYTSLEGVEFFVATSKHSGLDEGDVDRAVSKKWRQITGDRSQDYLTARAGDHLMVPFECDLCVFRKLMKRDPDDARPGDQLARQAIRRIILDSFWGRASPTVLHNVGLIRQILKGSAMLGLDGPFPDHGPFPPFDHCGYEVAINMVLASLRAGRHSELHLQFDTIRKMRSAYSNFIRAAPFSNAYPWVVADGEGKHYQRLAVDPCGSLWFLRFNEGCKKRMGQDWRPNQALTPPLVLEVLSWLDERIQNSLDPKVVCLFTLAATFYAVCYVLSLRGPEGSLLDLDGLIKEKDRNPSLFIVIALWGKIKGEHNERAHLLPSVNTTKSGIKIRHWIDRAVALQRSLGRTAGPLMQDRAGKRIPSMKLNEILHEALTHVFRRKPSLFPSAIKTEEDIREKINTFRSFRRGSDTRAHEEGVSESDINIVNRWVAEMKAGMSKPSLSMPQMYIDLSLLQKPFLRYTMAM